MAAPLYFSQAVEAVGTKIRRKDDRRDVRNALGVSSDPAPSLQQALQAAESLKRIIDMASCGRYGLAIVRPTFDTEVTQERIVEETTYLRLDRVAYTGRHRERSSLIHEPVSETIRRERHLRELNR